MPFPDAVKICLSKYVDFKGRARRSRVLVVCPLQRDRRHRRKHHRRDPRHPDLRAPRVPRSCCCPSLAVGIRRLHDTSRWAGGSPGSAIIPSVGWIVLLILYVQDSHRGQPVRPVSQGEHGCRRSGSRSAGRRWLRPAAPGSAGRSRLRPAAVVRSEPVRHLSRSTPAARPPGSTRPRGHGGRRRPGAGAPHGGAATSAALTAPPSSSSASSTMRAAPAARGPPAPRSGRGPGRRLERRPVMQVHQGVGRLGAPARDVEPGERRRGVLEGQPQPAVGLADVGQLPRRRVVRRPLDRRARPARARGASRPGDHRLAGLERGGAERRPARRARPGRPDSGSARPKPVRAAERGARPEPGRGAPSRRRPAGRPRRGWRRRRARRRGRGRPRRGHAATPFPTTRAAPRREERADDTAPSPYARASSAG